MARVERGFAVPPEVPRYLADKGLKPRFSWLDVWGEEHAHAFTVAKAVEVELLTAFRDSLKGAIDKGQGFETWRAGLKPELERLGWWGKRRVVDPTGADKPTAVDYSSPRRLKTIFSSNMRAARAAGQWERIQRTKAALPFLLYVRTTAAEPRREHLRWAGVILPVDDPFWRTHFPPNGWGCKCAVRQVTGREARSKLAEEGYTDQAPPLEEKPFRNRRTGAVTMVPDGIDPGWHTNPGLARARTLVTGLHERIEEAGPAVARRAIAELLDTPAPRVLAKLDEKLQLPVAVAETLQRDLDARSALLVVPNETVRRKSARHAPVSVDTFGLAQRIVDEGRVVDEGRSEGRARTVFAEIDGVWWELVVLVSKARYMRVQTLHRSDARKFAAALRAADRR